MTATVARCLTRGVGASRALEQIAEERDRLCGGRRLGGQAGCPDGAAKIAVGGVDLSQFDPRARIPGQRAERSRRVPASAVQPPECPLELGELHVRPCGRLGLTRGRRECQLHGGESPTPVADELPGVGDTSVRGEARTERDHPIERGERLVVASELHEGVPGDAVRAIRARQQSFRTAAVAQRRRGTRGE